MADGSSEHRCEWRDRVEALEAEVSACRSAMAQMERELAQLKKALLGPRSEKMPTPDEALRRQAARKGRPRKDGKQARQASAAARGELPEVEVIHEVGEAGLCGGCGQAPSKQLGEGKVSWCYEWQPGRFVKQKHVRRTLACQCGSHIVTAEGPAKVVDKGRYGPGFIAHVITAKCADSIPIYRMEKRYCRRGVPVARSTMTDLFHRSAELLSPVHERILEVIAAQRVVLADETSMPMQRKGSCKRGFVWVFLGGGMVGYRFSGDRSGETPIDVLGGTSGTLLVDGHTGYNQVCLPDGRDRAGCLAHARRKFFDALATAPVEAQKAMELILEVYRVEREAADAGVMGTDKHLEARRDRSRKAMAELFSLCEKWQPSHLPKGPMGAAIRYALNNREELSRFLDDAGLPVDNNASERALRVTALGRKNFLFVGHVQGGKNLAVLHTMVANCELRGIDPQQYLADVLIRVQDTPLSRIDELLPWNWKPPDSSAVAAA